MIRSKNKYFKRIPKRYREFLKSEIKASDTMIICVKFPPISLFKLKSKDYYWDFWNQLDGVEYPPDLEEAEVFFDRIVNGVFDEYGFGPFVVGGGDWSYMPIQDVNFKRKCVYDKEFRMVMVLDRKFTLNPFCQDDFDAKIKCIYVNDKKLKTYEELEKVIRSWLSKLKSKTDALVPKERMKGGETKNV